MISQTISPKRSSSPHPTKPQQGKTAGRSEDIAQGRQQERRNCQLCARSIPQHQGNPSEAGQGLHRMALA
ncbi:hypothetical protein K0M31_016692 [Melipona bicolor]|uniref:Uncharacterized protein n=1 Tax=Melipona bicolor TaxID=60889 RepID=A0AA40FE57_9HYME|nr:hypothetical protein K0M31_016692 [Melipona bicolor]